jgi:Na+-translocating ferredoxin:NAD+ oxidoreductase RnfG subunit
MQSTRGSERTFGRQWAACARAHGARRLLAGLLVLAATALAQRHAEGQEGVFLSEEEAPRAVFPEADAFDREVVQATPQLRARMRALLAGVEPSVWEDAYVTFRVRRDGAVIGRAVIVEEIGKHRPITFVIGVRPDGRVNDVAVMAYREAYGGEVRSKRFLVQYRDKSGADRLQPHEDIQNIAGATLSVEAAGRAVKKATAFVQAYADPGSGS